MSTNCWQYGCKNLHCGQLHLNKITIKTNSISSANLIIHCLCLISLVNKPLQVTNTTKVQYYVWLLRLQRGLTSWNKSPKSCLVLGGRSATQRLKGRSLPKSKSEGTGGCAVNALWDVPSLTSTIGLEAFTLSQMYQTNKQICPNVLLKRYNK